jgi:hypothetical protein
METARVDIRKLQLLNDRITQCLDALNQVRLTVHGLSHSGAQTGGAPVVPTMSGFGNPVDPRFAMQQGQGQQGIGQQGFVPTGIPGVGGGLSHSPYAQQAFGSPYALPFGPNPLAQFAPQGFGPSPYGGIQQGAYPAALQGSWGQRGLGHSEAERFEQPLGADPMIAYRVKETFPFVGYALPPIISLY